ncbi:hypothetical protein VU08_07340 [Desulfobulbus sp. F5]|nr:hypothetical protein [Desulfobulbus sp. F5]
MSIFSFAIGGILNLAFLIYYYFDDSASKGIVSTGGVVTAIITLVTQLDLIGHGKSAIDHWVFP